MASPTQAQPAPPREPHEPQASQQPAANHHTWTFLSNHAHVLVCLAEDPQARLRDLAQRVNITERAVQNIIVDLETAGVIQRFKQGRRNHYTLKTNQPLRHPVEAHRTIADLLNALKP
ncbi:helix-turn-helix transcriptional regulator [Mucisphaera sp.]|uniref:helix-turn-helix transcriptional regulator n=1 Tax=Mucisphaera sp. TaxID=2913024 RepID=UPI003D13139E